MKERRLAGENLGSNKRTKILNIRMTESEYELLTALAEQLGGSSRSEVMRRALHAYSGVLSTVFRKEKG